MNVLETIFGAVQPQANAAATGAANAALDEIAARPFQVVVTIDPTTRDWLTLLAIGLLVGGIAVIAYLNTRTLAAGMQRIASGAKPFTGTTGGIV